MTKSMAEQKILGANGSKTEDGHSLHTCALRLAAIYGPGDQRHIPRIVVRHIYSTYFEAVGGILVSGCSSLCWFKKLKLGFEISSILQPPKITAKLTRNLFLSYV